MVGKLTFPSLGSDLADSFHCQEVGHLITLGRGVFKDNLTPMQFKRQNNFFSITVR